MKCQTGTNIVEKLDAKKRTEGETGCRFARTQKKPAAKQLHIKWLELN